VPEAIKKKRGTWALGGAPDDWKSNNLWRVTHHQQHNLRRKKEKKIRKKERGGVCSWDSNIRINTATKQEGEGWVSPRTDDTMLRSGGRGTRRGPFLKDRQIGGSPTGSRGQKVWYTELGESKWAEEMGPF